MAKLATAENAELDFLKNSVASAAFVVAIQCLETGAQ